MLHTCYTFKPPNCPLSQMHVCVVCLSKDGRASKDKRSNKRGWMITSSKGGIEVEVFYVGWGLYFRFGNWERDYCHESVQAALSTADVSETCITIWCIFDPDQPYSANPGREQEEDLHQETTLHVRLRTIGHCLPTHTAAAGDHCGACCHRATTGVCMCVSYGVLHALKHADQPLPLCPPRWSMTTPVSVRCTWSVTWQLWGWWHRWATTAYLFSVAPSTPSRYVSATEVHNILLYILSLQRSSRFFFFFFVHLSCRLVMFLQTSTRPSILPSPCTPPVSSGWRLFLFTLVPTTRSSPCALASASVLRWLFAACSSQR